MSAERANPLLPAPASVRLWNDAARPALPPFGVARFDAAGEAIAVALHAESAWPSIDAIAAQTPDARALPEGTLVVLLGDVAAPAGFFGRLLRAKPRDVARAVRASALLARGFVRVGAGVDARGLDLVWGYTPVAPLSGCG